MKFAHSFFAASAVAFVATACSSSSGGSEVPTDGGASSSSSGTASSSSSSSSGAGGDASPEGSSTESPDFPILGQLAVMAGNDVSIDIDGFADGCALVVDGNSHKQDSQYWSVSIRGSMPIVPGTYPLGATADAQVTIAYKRFDAICKKAERGATKGSVTIKSASPSLVEGSFTATFDGFGDVTKSFSAPVCDLSGQTGSSKCVP